MSAQLEVVSLEDVASICNGCGKEDLDVEQVHFCDNCLQVAFCSERCADDWLAEHKECCTKISVEQYTELIGPRMGRGGRPGGRGGFRPGGSRPGTRPRGGFRPYRPSRFPGRYPGGRYGTRWFSRGGRVPWAPGLFNPFWYSAYSLWYPAYWTPNFSYTGVLPVLPALASMVDQAIINQQLMSLRADPSLMVPGAMIVPDPTTGRFIYVGV